MFFEQHQTAPNSTIGTILQAPIAPISNWGDLKEGGVQIRVTDGWVRIQEDVALYHQFYVRYGTARFNLSRRHIDYLFKTDTDFTARAPGSKEQLEGCMEGTIIVTIYGAHTPGPRQRGECNAKANF